MLQGIYALNFRKPSKIQERALPLLLSNPPTNMIGQSQSGTGKTAAFVLNMLARIDTNIQVPQALVLCPSRELARQIVGVVQTMGQFVQGLNVTQSIPDPSQRGKRIEGQIVVGTPGTVMDQIRRKQLESAQIKVLVLDEADNMLDQQGLGDQCTRVKMSVSSPTYIDHPASNHARRLGSSQKQYKTFSSPQPSPTTSSATPTDSPRTQISLLSNTKSSPWKE